MLNGIRKISDIIKTGIMENVTNSIIYTWNLKCGYCNVSDEVVNTSSDYIDCPECKRKLKVLDGIWIGKKQLVN